MMVEWNAVGVRSATEAETDFCAPEHSNGIGNALECAGTHCMVSAFVNLTGDASEKVSGIPDVAFNALAVVVVFAGNATRVDTAFVVSAGIDASSLSSVVRSAYIMNIWTVKVVLALILPSTAINWIFSISLEALKTGALRAMVERVANGIRSALSSVTGKHALVSTETHL